MQTTVLAEAFLGYKIQSRIMHLALGSIEKKRISNREAFIAEVDGYNVIAFTNGAVLITGDSNETIDFVWSLFTTKVDSFHNNNNIPLRKNPVIIKTSCSRGYDADADDEGEEEEGQPIILLDGWEREMDQEWSNLNYDDSDNNNNNNNNW